ncbi:MAG: DUF3109 family protein [Bacteroidales bacterium]|nr:DUF3109 family protein [Bacteroidales bacterium]
MLIINDILIDEDIFLQNFVCDLRVCKGRCCIEGDLGAPLESKELDLLEKYYPKVKSYLSDENRKAIEEQGFGIVDDSGDLDTPLAPDRACAYVTRRDGILKCAYECAYLDGKIPWRKPASCYLYPIRVGKVGPYKTLKFDRWHICDCALIKGERQGVPCYKFLEGPLTDVFGEDFYRQLCEVGEAWLSNRDK